MNKTLNCILKDVFDLTDEQLQKDLKRGDINKWDSLAHMELVLSLENEYEIEFTIDEIIEMKSLETIRVLMQKKGVTA